MDHKEIRIDIELPYDVDSKDVLHDATPRNDYKNVTKNLTQNVTRKIEKTKNILIKLLKSMKLLR